jgi:hypothetical protein
MYLDSKLYLDKSILSTSFMKRREYLSCNKLSPKFRTQLEKEGETNVDINPFQEKFNFQGICNGTRQIWASADPFSYNHGKDTRKVREWRVNLELHRLGTEKRWGYSWEVYEPLDYFLWNWWGLCAAKLTMWLIVHMLSIWDKWLRAGMLMSSRNTIQGLKSWYTSG